MASIKVAAPDQGLTYRRILVFWAPLAAQWIMMSMEGPFLSAVIARLAEPKFNLAAYGVALSLALIAEAPIIMIMSASTALVKDRDSYLKLRRFSNILNLLVTLSMGLVLIPPVFNFLARDLLELPTQVSGLTWTSLLILLPWPAVIGYRRFFHGILIVHNKTRYVAYGTLIRLLAMALSGLVGFFLFPTQGAYIAAAAMSIAVILEAVATRLMAGKVVAGLLLGPERQGNGAGLTYGQITTFYIPLALTSLLALGLRPIVTFCLSQSRMALESLAVLPVVHSLIFIFISLGLSYQEVGIALLSGRRDNYEKLRNFALATALATILGLALITWTPGVYLWFHDLSGLSLELTSFSIIPARIMTILPGLTMAIFFQRALLMSARKTGPITWATGLEVTVIVIVLLAGINFLDMVGILAAAVAMLAGSLASNLFLLPRSGRTLTSMEQVAG